MVTNYTNSLDNNNDMGQLFQKYTHTCTNLK